MFNLTENDIRLAQNATNKAEVIVMVASALEQAGLVGQGYAEVMLERESQAPTYLANGIAIPHGTIAARDKVLKTGIQVFQFPQGIRWNDDEIAYIVIGIAACSNEHVPLLQQLTQLLADKALGYQLAHTSAKQAFMSVLKAQTLLFNQQLIHLNVEIADLPRLLFFNGQNLLQAKAVNCEFVAEAINQNPLELGEGIWFSASREGCLINAITLSRLAKPIVIGEKPLVMLITASIANSQFDHAMAQLEQTITVQQLACLKTAAVPELIKLLTQLLRSTEPAADEQHIEVMIDNEHGLPIQSGRVWVNTVKPLNSDVTVTNLDGNNKSVNGQSLMKLVTIAAKKGDRLLISAKGEDAEQALAAVKHVITDGSGE